MPSARCAALPVGASSGCCSGNAGLRDLVEDWELRVNLLAESAPAVEPPPHVWEQIASGSGRSRHPCVKAGSSGCGTASASGVASVPGGRRRCRGLGRLCRAAAAGRRAGADRRARPAAHRYRNQAGRRRSDAARDRRARRAARAHRGRNRRAWRKRRAKSPLSATGWPASKAGSMRPCRCPATWPCCSTRTRGR